jgi:hypothetical protein
LRFPLIFHKLYYSSVIVVFILLYSDLFALDFNSAHSLKHISRTSQSPPPPTCFSCPVDVLSVSSSRGPKIEAWSTYSQSTAGELLREGAAVHF